MLLERITETARQLCDARYAALGVLDEDRHELAQFVTAGEDPSVHAAIGHLPKGRGVLGLLIDQPAPLRLTEISDHPRSFGFPAGHPPMRNFLGAPIVVRGQAWGNLYLTEKEHGADFDEDDVEAIVVLAEWAAIAIDNARLFGVSERRRQELERAVGGMEAARDIALALGGETDLERILALIAKRARALVEAQVLLIWLEDGSVLRLAAHAGIDKPSVPVEIPLDDSTSGAALRSGRSVRTANAQRDLRVHPALFGVVDATDALLVPLTFRGRGLGVLAAFDHTGRATPFSGEDELALRSFAASAATAVATARSVEAQQARASLETAEAERRRWARDLHDQTLQGLGAVKLTLAAGLRGDEATARAQIAGAVGQLEGEIVALRDIIAGIRPPALDELGLAPALRTLAVRVAATLGLDVTVELDPALEERRLAPECETIAYRVAQEALTNVGRHAAASRVRVEVDCADDGLELRVVDDGRGIGASRDGYGMTGMRERAELGGGHLRVGARPGGGTVVTLTLPLCAQ